MYLLTLILGIVLLPEASTLNCYECLPGRYGTCTDTIKQCPSQCATIRMVTYAGASKLLDVNGKSCALPEQCGEYSVNFGFSRTVVTNKCCTSDLCNTQPAPEPSKTNPNGRKCFSCNGQTCTATVNCQGKEDYCISGTGSQTMTVKGCATKAICSQTLNSVIAADFGTGIRCCQGNYCNSASSTSAGAVTETTRSRGVSASSTSAGTVTKTTRSRGVSASSTSAGLLLLVTPLISLILN